MNGIETVNRGPLTEAEIGTAAELWNSGGDTEEIARVIGVHESFIARRLGAGREVARELLRSAA